MTTHQHEAEPVTTYLKALGPNREAINGGSGTWPEPGVWTHDVTPIPCEQGWHVCSPTQMLQWLPDTSNDIWLVEIVGTIIDAGDKTVAQRARLIRKLDWTDRTARLFAADCADQVLHLFEAQHPDDDRPRKAIDVARRYANGEATDQERDAAGAAAWDASGAAARDAARDAAGVAAWDAAWAPARDAAWDAAWAATGDAARAAARAATGDAARAAQGELLMKHLGVAA